MQSFMSKSTYNVECSYPTHIKILVESGIANTTTSSNISTIPITILYTSKIYIFLNHNTGTILVYNTGTNLYTSIVLCTILVYQYCDRQVQEIPTFSNISAISWRPVLVVEEAGVPGENHRPWPWASNW